VVFINTNMFDVPFELPAGTDEPARVNRHLEETLRDAGFVSIFENRFFHSLVVYPKERSVDAFLAKLRAIAADETRPLATRATLAMMARTTVETERHPRSYRPFTDAWAPEIVLELKSNHARLYRALAREPAQGEAASHPLLRVVRKRLLAEHASGNNTGAITDTAALVRELDALPMPLTAADHLLAARHLRFEQLELPALTPHSPWAKLAAGYARMYAAGLGNDYEQLAQVLRELD